MLFVKVIDIDFNQVNDFVQKVDLYLVKIISEQGTPSTRCLLNDNIVPSHVNEEVNILKYPRKSEYEFKLLYES